MAGRVPAAGPLILRRSAIVKSRNGEEFPLFATLVLGDEPGFQLRNFGTNAFSAGEALVWEQKFVRPWR